MDGGTPSEMAAWLLRTYGGGKAGGSMTAPGSLPPWQPGTGGPGCTCQLCVPQGSPPPLPTPGIAGFSDEVFAAGTVTGYRWWALPGPDFRRGPLTADEHWPRNLLQGQRDEWQPGVNEAVCLAGPGAHGEPVPAGECGCGLWAFKTLKYHSLGYGMGRVPVAGVIEGWGRTRTGSLGFRCATARILALCPQFKIQPYREQAGWYDVFGDAHTAEIPPEDTDRLEAWMAVIETRLEETYPDARIFTVQKAMLAAFPLTAG
jgi:hypothetical protein